MAGLISDLVHNIMSGSDSATQDSTVGAANSAIPEAGPKPSESGVELPQIPSAMVPKENLAVPQPTIDTANSNAAVNNQIASGNSAIANQINNATASTMAATDKLSESSGGGMGSMMGGMMSMMSDRRVKKNILSSESDIDALLNQVYVNLQNRKRMK